MRYKFYFLFVISVMCTNEILAGFGAYQPIQVNHYLGKPIINIPFHVFKSGSLEIPISLSYNSDLVKPGYNSNGLAVGWELICGGAINRVVNGPVDESKSFGDTFLDEFSFNFLGYSGTFYYSQGSFVVDSEHNIIVEPLSDSPYLPASSIVNLAKNRGRSYGYSCDFDQYRGFVLTTPDGNRYVFGSDLNSIELSAAGSRDSEFNFSSSDLKLQVCTWRLSEAQGKTAHAHISFFYESSPIEYSTFPYWEDRSFSFSGRYGSGNINVGFKEERPISHSDLIIQKLGVRLVGLCRNSHVNCHNGYEVWFSPTGCTIEERFGLKKSFSYIFNDNSFLVPDGKKILVEIKSNDSSLSFRYNEFGSFRFGDKRDHWGFFNNVSISGLLHSDLAEAREPDPEYATCGLLNRITYETKGYADLEWEPHYYSMVADDKLYEDKVAGGARIKRLSTFDTDNRLIDQQTFVYAKNYTNDLTSIESSGVIYSYPVYSHGGFMPESPVVGADEGRPMSRNGSRGAYVQGGGGVSVFQKRLRMLSIEPTVNHILVIQKWQCSIWTIHIRS